MSDATAPSPVLTMREEGPPTPEDILMSMPRIRPMAALACAQGTDIETEAEVLYLTVNHLKPRRIVELGTRQAISTRIIAAARQGHPRDRLDGYFITIDPADCRPYLQGVEVEFVQATGEEVFATLALFADLLMIDTDPHDFEQTTRWLETWVRDRLNPGGVALFHDIIPGRPEIQVADAVRAWLPTAPGWTWHEYRPTGTPAHGPYGLGMLWRPR